MWHVIGQSLSSHAFTSLLPKRVLYDFDGPRTFTVADANGDLFLAHWSDEDDLHARFLVVPWSDRMTARLTAGEVSVSAALDQPRIFVVDVAAGGTVRNVTRVDWDDIPPDALPAPGVTLHFPKSNVEVELGELVGS